jgi:hypothetical protein
MDSWYEGLIIIFFFILTFIQIAMDRSILINFAMFHLQNIGIMFLINCYFTCRLKYDIGCIQFHIDCEF